MRVPKAIKVLLAGVLVLFLLLVCTQLTSKYVRFEHQSPKYRADFAAACDSILAHYPLGTNGYLEIPTNDTFLPKIVSELHPEKIKISTNQVWVLVDGSHTDGLLSRGLRFFPGRDMNMTYTSTIPNFAGADAGLRLCFIRASLARASDAQRSA
jgi:hypothetical protein